MTLKTYRFVKRSDSTMTTTDDAPSCRSILDLGWSRFKIRVFKTFCQESKKADSIPSGLKFLKCASFLQIILGFVCICLALVGLMAAFRAREDVIRDNYYSLKYDQSNYYRNMIANISRQAEMNYDKTVKYFSEIIHKMNRTWTSGDLPRPGNYERSTDYYREIMYVKDFCNDPKNDCSVSRNMDKHHLIVNYLGIPSWTGFMLIIIGCVGLRMVNKWDKIEYFQVSQSYTLLNMFNAILFAPGMLTAGILQVVFSDYWGHTFRFVVGEVTIGFAGVIMVFSIIICVISCCCPINPRKSFYKELSENLTQEEDQGKPDESASTVVVA